MSTSLCFHCGELKLKATRRCAKCGVKSYGDRYLDDRFSDNQMSLSSLTQFGNIIRQLALHGENPTVCFWAFLEHVSSQPKNLLGTTTPDELTDRVRMLLAAANLPTVIAEFKPLPLDAAPEQRAVRLPSPVSNLKWKGNDPLNRERVQLRRKSGSVVEGELLQIEGELYVLVNGDLGLVSDEIVAIRKAPRRFLGWIFPPAWFEFAKSTDE